MDLNISGLLNKIDGLRYIAGSSNAAVIGVTETKLDSTIYFNTFMILRSQQTVRTQLEMVGTETVEGQLVVLEITFVLTGKILSLTIQETFSLIFCFQKQSLYLQVLYTNPRVKASFSNKCLQSLRRPTQITIFTFLAIFNINLLFREKYVLNKSNEI